MISKKVRNLIDVNRSFYDKVWLSFSKTRQNPWKGWGRVAEIIREYFKSSKSLSIIDLGCGNGRFYKYISEDLSKSQIKYLGLDTNHKLLEIAREANPSARFQHYDVIGKISQLTENADIVVAFGITHHIPNSNDKCFRLEWFKSLTSLINPNGMLIFTIWNIFDEPKFEKKIHEKLSDTDFLINWQDEKNAQRYYHAYTKSELDLIIEIMNKHGFRLHDKFNSDGKSGVSNAYYVFSRT